MRVPIQERVPCGHHSERERYLGFALTSVANEGEKFRSRRTPYCCRAGSPRAALNHISSGATFSHSDSLTARRHDRHEQRTRGTELTNQMTAWPHSRRTLSALPIPLSSLPSRSPSARPLTRRPHATRPLRPAAATRSLDTAIRQTQHIPTHTYTRAHPLTSDPPSTHGTHHTALHILPRQTLVPRRLYILD